jgi:hypothetical protein
VGAQLGETDEALPVALLYRVVANHHLAPHFLNRRVLVDPELGYKASNDAKETGPVIKAVLDQLKELIRSARRPRTGHRDLELALGALPVPAALSSPA